MMTKVYVIEGGANIVRPDGVATRFPNTVVRSRREVMAFIETVRRPETAFNDTAKKLIRNWLENEDSSKYLYVVAAIGTWNYDWFVVNQSEMDL